jgi:hypothetical protein
MPDASKSVQISDSLVSKISESLQVSDSSDILNTTKILDSSKIPDVCYSSSIDCSKSCHISST